MRPSNTFSKPVTREVELPMPIPLIITLPDETPQPVHAPIEAPGILVPNWPTKVPVTVEPDVEE